MATLYKGDNDDDDDDDDDDDNNNNNNNNNNNKVRAHLRYSICQLLGIETKDRCWADKAIYEHEDVSVLWNQAEHTDREVTGKRSGVIIKNNKKRDNKHNDRRGKDQQAQMSRKRKQKRN